jgi:hypothetical protein
MVLWTKHSGIFGQMSARIYGKNVSNEENL